MDYLSDAIYNQDSISLHGSVMQQINDEQLEGAGFAFVETKETKMEVHKVDLHSPFYILIYLIKVNPINSQALDSEKPQFL